MSRHDGADKCPRLGPQCLSRHHLSGSTQDCADLHSFGPGMREIYILHYVLRGRGVFEENGRAYPVETGGTFLVRPRAVIRYAPDPADPWEYIWVDFCGSEAAALLRQTGFSFGCPVAPPLPREEMEPLYRRILAAGDGHKEYHQARATGYLHVLLSTYMEKFPPDRPMDDGYGYVQSSPAVHYHPLPPAPVGGGYQPPISASAAPTCSGCSTGSWPFPPTNTWPASACRAPAPCFQAATCPLKASPTPWGMRISCISPRCSAG